MPKRPADPLPTILRLAADLETIAMRLRRGDWHDTDGRFALDRTGEEMVRALDAAHAAYMPRRGRKK